MLTICTRINTEGTSCARSLVLVEKTSVHGVTGGQQSLHMAVETTLCFKVHYSKYSIRKCQVYVCVYGSGGVGVNSSHSSLSVGGEAQRSIKTAHQCPHKRLASRCAYRSQHVLPSAYDKSRNHAHKNTNDLHNTTITNYSPPSPRQTR